MTIAAPLSYIYMESSTAQFSDAMRQCGLIPPEQIITDGKIHRFASNGKSGDDAGWYTYHGGDVAVGAFGCWRLGINETWCAKIGRALNAVEIEAHKQKIEAMRRERESEIAKHYAEGKAKAKAVLSAAKPATGDHPYEVRKKIDVCPGVMRGAWSQRQKDDCLLIPMCDDDGTLWNVQAIFPEKDQALGRDKDFLYGARKTELFFLIGQLDGASIILIGEGYATMMSCYMAAGLPAVVSFDAGNILSVVKALRKKYPNAKLIIAGDDDKWRVDSQGKPIPNTGRIKAEEAAKRYGCRTAFPVFAEPTLEHLRTAGEKLPTDWNDLHCLEGIEVVKAQLLAGDWQEPEKIGHTLLPVPLLPESIIPEPFRPWVADVAYRMQCPPDMAAAAAIVMTGAVIGAGCGIRPKRKDDWLVIPNLYGGIVGRPSILMKSPTLKEALKPITRLEATAKEGFDTAQRYHEAEMAETEARRKKILKSMGKATDTDALKGQYAALQDPQAPTWRRFRTNDATIEKLSELLNENPRGLLVFRDELTGLLSSWEKDGHEADRAYFLEAWNGTGDHYTDRIGRGTIYTENMCLSVFGGTQPSKLQNFLYANRLTNDGAFQRFNVMVYPDEPEHWELIDQYPDTKAKNRAYEIIKKLADMVFTDYGATLEEGEKIPYFRFTEEGQEVFNEWLTELETKKIRGNDEPMLVEHFGKYRKLMPVLALIFHLIMVADGKATGAVSKEAAELAAAWCDYLEAHARRIYGLVSTISMQAAYNLSRRIAKDEVKDHFTVRDIYHNQWSLLTDRDMVQPACDILVKKRWLKEVETPAAFQQKAKTEYLINPKTRGFYG